MHKVTLTLDKETINLLKHYKKETGVNRSEAVRQAVKKFMLDKCIF